MNRASRTPNLFIVGAMKGGTTSAFACLSQIPDVFTPKIKEPQHFSTDLYDHPHAPMRWTVHAFANVHLIKGRGRYLAEYAEAPTGARYVVDASTSYLYSADAAANIAAFAPDAKIVILLRDPVARAWSEYKMNQFIGLETESFDQAVAREHREICEGRSFLFRRYLLASSYGDQVERYMKAFPRENVFIDVVDRPGDGLEGALRRLVRFLELPSDTVLNIQRENESRAPFNRWVNSALYYSGAKALLSRLTPDTIKAGAKSAYYHRSRTEIDRPNGDLIAEMVEPSTRKLEALTGLRIDHWPRPGRPLSSVRAPMSMPVLSRTGTLHGK